MIDEFKTMPEQPTREMIEVAYPLIEAMKTGSIGRDKQAVQSIYQAMWQVAPSIPNTGLTKLQLKVHEFLAAYIQLHRVSPTLTEIADGCGMNGRANAHKVIEVLERKGILTRGARLNFRNIRLKIQPGMPLPEVKKRKRR